MTLAQIQYFLEVARCKNISEAAKHLFITQPTLGRQLTAIESELNMQLMIRSNKGIKLTPAGIVLQEEFEKVMTCYKSGVERAGLASRGFSGTLSIGILEELKIKDLIPPAVDYFDRNYPNIDIEIKRMSFRGLLEGIYHNKLDAAISLDINFPKQSDLEIQNLKPYHPAFAVPIHHRLSKKEHLEYRDFREIPLAIVGKDECAEGVKKIEWLFKKCGGFYPDFYFTDSMKDAVLWVESGKKCAVLNMEMQAADSKLIKMYPFEANDNTWIQFASKAENDNIALRLLKDFYMEC